MPFGLDVTSEPATEPITLEEAKLHCRVWHNADDVYLTSLIKAARRYAETLTARAFVTQTLKLTLDCFPANDGPIRLPKPPLSSVTTVKYYDTDNTLQTLASTEYVVDALTEPGRILVAYDATWPGTYERPAAVEVTYVAGYGAASAVPETVKSGMKMMIEHWYGQRSAVSATQMSRVPLAAADLLGMEWSGSIVGDFG